MGQVGEIGFPVFEAVKMVQTQAQHAGGRQDVVLRRDETAAGQSHKYVHVSRVHNSTDMMVRVCRRTLEYKLLGKEKFWVTYSTYPKANNGGFHGGATV